MALPQSALSVLDALRVGVAAAGDAPLGALWISRQRHAGPPDAATTRLLSLAADQLGLAWRREQLAREAKEADLAKRGEQAHAALLRSVSHDLRTPLGSIRATAGALADQAVSWTDAERQEAGTRIDGEADRLNRLVSNLLDLSRIQARARARGSGPACF